MLQINPIILASLSGLVIVLIMILIIYLLRHQTIKMMEREDKREKARIVDYEAAHEAAHEAAYDAAYDAAHATAHATACNAACADTNVHQGATHEAVSITRPSLYEEKPVGVIPNYNCTTKNTRKIESTTHTVTPESTLVSDITKADTKQESTTTLPKVKHKKGCGTCCHKNIEYIEEPCNSCDEFSNYKRFYKKYPKKTKV